MTATPRSTLLQRFRRDVSGNALAIMGAAVLPLVAAVGAAIDISRDYMAKSRLQQACDAGVLAGRKAQGGGLYSVDEENEATEYFRINFPDDIYQTNSTVFTSTESNTNEVVGSAATFVPSTLGRIIGYQGTQIDVNCTARLDITNTDVMFVLDNSGSMTGGSGTPGVSRIQALRQAVRDFHSTLEGAKSGDIRLRYGFVTYNSAVNPGAALMTQDSSLVADQHVYQSRLWYDGPSHNGLLLSANDSGFFSHAINQTWCSRNAGTWTQANARCQVRGVWLHAPLTYDVSAYKTSASWKGCVEERKTVDASSFSPIPAGATDLDVDSAPTSEETKWAPMIDALYMRDRDNIEGFGQNDSNTRGPGDTPVWNGRKVDGECPTAKAQIVEELSAGEVNSYVNSINPAGGTYHDIGMIWAVRLLSPTGIWQSHNTQSPNGLPIQRHIIFMTDGEMAPRYEAYTMYGAEPLDKRVVGGKNEREKPNNPVMIARHNARFLAMCDVARQHNIRVWTVAFGTRLEDTRLVQCADSGRAFQADSATELNDTFRRIATRIADLRLEE